MISLLRVFHARPARSGARTRPRRRGRDGAPRQPLEAQGFELVGARAAGHGRGLCRGGRRCQRDVVESGRLAGHAHLRWGRRLRARSIPSRIGRLKTRALPGRTGRCCVAAAFPVAALSFTRVHQWRLEPVPTAGPSAGRQEGGRVPAAQSLLTQHFGVSLAQSLGDAVVVGVTARLVRGGVSSAGSVGGSIDEAFDRAADATRATATTGDVDAGVLVRLARVRLGLSARNLAAPTFHGRRRRQLDAGSPGPGRAWRWSPTPTAPGASRGWLPPTPT